MLRTLLMMVPALLFANIFAGSATKHSMDIKGDYAKSKQCIRCHLDIYEEYKSSAHFRSIPERDPIHAKIVALHAKATKAKGYACAKCHAPAVKDRMNYEKDPYYHEAIACAYCHRIERIEEHPKANTNIILPKKGAYYGTRHPETRSDYHKIIADNPIHKDGRTCLGCHSHKRNAKGFVVCRTEANMTQERNCITCHMPQVEGSLSDRVNTPTHAYHGFASLENNEALRRYVQLELQRSKNKLCITVHNRAPHALLLHPLRMARLVVKIYGKRDVLQERHFDFVRVIGDGKPTPPWLAKEVIKDTMLKGGEERSFELELPESATRVEVKLYLYRINPKIAKKLQLPSKAILFKEEALAL